MLAEIKGTLCVLRRSARELIFSIEYSFIFLQTTYFKVRYKMYGYLTYVT
jgi:hypothetical protein